MIDDNKSDLQPGAASPQMEARQGEVFGSEAALDAAAEDLGAPHSAAGLSDETLASLRPASRSGGSVFYWKDAAAWFSERGIEPLVRGEPAAEFPAQVEGVGPTVVVASDHRLARFVVISQFRNAKVVDLELYDRKHAGLPTAATLCAAAAELEVPVVLDLSGGASSEYIRACAREARGIQRPFILLLETRAASDLIGQVTHVVVPELEVLQYLVDRLGLRGKTGDTETFTNQVKRQCWKVGSKQLDVTGVLDQLLTDDETFQDFNQQVVKNFDETRPANIYEEEGRRLLLSVIDKPNSLVLPTLLLLSEFEKGLPLQTYRALMQPFVEAQEDLPEGEPRGRLGQEVLALAGARSRRPPGGMQIVKMPDNRVCKGVRDGFEGEGALEADTIFRTLLGALPGITVDEQLLPALGKFLARAVWAMGGAQPSDASRALLSGFLAAVPPRSQISVDTASLRMQQLLTAFATDIRGHGHFGDDIVVIAQRIIALLPRHIRDEVDASLFFRCLGRALAMLEFSAGGDSGRSRNIPIPPAACMRGYLSQLEILLGNSPELALPYAHAALAITPTRREEALFLERGALIALGAAAGARYEAWSEASEATEADEEQARWIAETLYSDRLGPYFEDPHRQEMLWVSCTGPTLEEKQIAHRSSSTLAEVRAALSFAAQALFLPNMLMKQVGEDFATQTLQAWVEQRDPTARGNYLRPSRWMRDRESGSSRTDDLARSVRAGRTAQLVSLLGRSAPGLDLRQLLLYERSPTKQARLQQASNDIADFTATCNSVFTIAKAKTTRETRPDFDRLVTNFRVLSEMLRATTGRG